MTSQDRGLAMGIVIFVSILVIGSLLYILLDAAMSELFTMTLAQAETQQATDQINLAQSIWDLVLYVVVFIAGLFIIARAVLESKQPG